VYRQALFQWLIYALLFGFVIGANNAAHIGGALAGMALAYIPEPHPRRSPLLKPMWSGAFYICGLLWLVTLGFLVLSIVVNWSPGGVPPEMPQ
jgi:rhomboid protease GluP